MQLGTCTCSPQSLLLCPVPRSTRPSCTFTSLVATCHCRPTHLLPTKGSAATCLRQRSAPNLAAAGSMAATAPMIDEAVDPEAATSSEPSTSAWAPTPARTGQANTLHHRRRLARKVDEISLLVQTIAAPLGSSNGTDGRAAAWLGAEAASSSAVDWSAVPAPCNPADVLGAGAGSAKQEARARRKRLQVESFVLVLQRMLSQWPHQHQQLQQQVTAQPAEQPFPSTSAMQQQQQQEQQQAQCTQATPAAQPCHLVDFGSGTGNLVLALAHFFPHCRFTAVDMKPEALRLLQQRVQQAGLSNVSVWRGQIEYFDEPFDVALALHACGNATDYALAKAVEIGAAYVVSPCCVGKLKFSMMGGSSFHPTLSTWTPQLPGDRPTARSRVRGNSKPDQPGTSDSSSTITAALLASGAAQEQQHSNGASSDAAGSNHTAAGSDTSAPAAAAAAAAGAGSDSAAAGHDDASAAQAPQQPMQLQHPRSAWLTNNLSPEPQRLFANLARVADYAHTADAAPSPGVTEERSEAAELCKRIVEWDRNEAAREAGYAVGLVKMLGAQEMTKSDVLIGVPTDAAVCADSSAGVQRWRHCWPLLAMPSKEDALGPGAGVAVPL